MADKKPRPLLRTVGYFAFGLWALVTALFLTFPYDAVKECLQQEASRAGLELKMRSLGPGWAALTASDVEVSKKSDLQPPPQALLLDSLSVGPTLFPPGVAVKAAGLGGTMTARISQLSSLRIKVDLEGIDLSKGNVSGVSGINLSGIVDARLDVTIPKAAPSPGAPIDYDLTQASGSISLSAKDLAVNGGTVMIPIPPYPDPTPIDLPKIGLGEVSGKVSLDKGTATVDEFKTTSSDLESTASGTTKLAKRLEYSEANLEVRFRPNPEFQRRLGPIALGISAIGPDPRDPTWRLGRLTGYLGRPQFR